MKVIVTGGTGFVAAEVIRQGLQRADVTSLVVLSRKPIAAPDVDAASARKLKQVLVENYAEYPEDVTAEFADADSCIWTVAVTPGKSKAYNADDLRRICYDSPIAGLRAMHGAKAAKPFRFLYMSGHGAQRDATKAPYILGPYLILRGETESKLVEIAKQHPGEIEVCIARPGLVTSGINLWRTVWGTALRVTSLTTIVSRDELAAAVLDQALTGFEGETLSNDDLVRIGRASSSR